jgi:hypothetical protein
VTSTDGNTVRNTAQRDGPPRFSLFALLATVTVCAGLFGLTRIAGNIVLVWIAAAQRDDSEIPSAFQVARRII